MGVDKLACTHLPHGQILYIPIGSVENIQFTRILPLRLGGP